MHTEGVPQSVVVACLDRVTEVLHEGILAKIRSATEEMNRALSILARAKQNETDAVDSADALLIENKGLVVRNSELERKFVAESVKMAMMEDELGKITTYEERDQKQSAALAALQREKDSLEQEVVLYKRLGGPSRNNFRTDTIEAEVRNAVDKSLAATAELMRQQRITLFFRGKVQNLQSRLRHEKTSLIHQFKRLAFGLRFVPSEATLHQRRGQRRLGLEINRYTGVVRTAVLMPRSPRVEKPHPNLLLGSSAGRDYMRELERENEVLQSELKRLKQDNEEMIESFKRGLKMAAEARSTTALADVQRVNLEKAEAQNRNNQELVAELQQTLVQVVEEARVLRAEKVAAWATGASGPKEEPEAWGATHAESVESITCPPGPSEAELLGSGSGTRLKERLAVLQVEELRRRLLQANYRASAAEALNLNVERRLARQARELERKFRAAEEVQRQQWLERLAEAYNSEPSLAGVAGVAAPKPFAAYASEDAAALIGSSLSSKPEVPPARSIPALPDGVFDLVLPGAMSNIYLPLEEYRNVSRLHLHVVYEPQRISIVNEQGQISIKSQAMPGGGSFVSRAVVVKLEPADAGRAAS